MNIDLYSYSLCIALTLMLFVSMRFIFGRIPDKLDSGGNYLRSRRIMGTAILLLSANYAVHLFVDIRAIEASAAIIMNLCTYFIAYGFFVAALHTLLNRNYITGKMRIAHFSLSGIYVIAALLILFFVKDPSTKSGLTHILASILAIYGVVLASRLLDEYRKAVKIMNDTQSDNIEHYFRWMSILTYWMLIFGLGCSLLTFLPDKLVYLWVLSSIPFYIYIYVSYANYCLFYKTVELIMESNEKPVGPSEVAESLLSKQILEWCEADGYLQPGLTITDLAKTIHTNRTYLSAYINQTYGISFREWISRLRIDYAKKSMLENPEMSIAEISEKSGFLSISNFNSSFKEKEGTTPLKWKKSKMPIG